MFITKIILDGFKSYGRRVELTGFDDSFNAITGFNGSGKSNILDAIVFVLGLSKMEMARCHTLTDLIYKNGQTGVTTASVTIELDNSDNKFEHTEYRGSKKIVVRREVNLKNQSKYFIDGFSVTREKLLDFFQAVSLNIQNPHFLIMQGKIVKTSAAKPTEILSMVEEVVGVSSYENKKKHNLAKIAKCDKTLDEIKKMLAESILPKVKQLQEEQQKLVKYHDLEAKYNLKHKIYIAYCYMKNKDIVDNADQNIANLNEEINQKHAENAEFDEEHKLISREIEELQDRLNEEVGGNLKELETDLAAKRTRRDKILTDQKIKAENIKEEETKMNNLRKNLERDTKVAEKKKKDFENAKNRLESLREENATNEANMAKAESNFQKVTLGLAASQDGDEASGTLAQQVMTAQDELGTVEASENKSKLVIQNYTKELEQKKHKVQSDKNSYEKALSDIQVQTRETEVLQNEMANMQFDEERFNQLKARKAETKKMLQSENEKLRSCLQRVPMFRFQFNLPDGRVKKEDVHGVACELFSLKDPKHALAIEKVCGARLWNVIVSNEKVATEIMRNGQLKERRTLLPLNKVQGPSIDTNAFRIAERLVGKGNVHNAINLVTYDRVYEPAMKRVFGDTLVCADIEMAKKVAFADGVRKRTVTLDGEIFDPSGTLTGGHIAKGEQLLNIVAEIIKTQAEIRRLNLNMQQDDEEYQRLDRYSKPYSEKKATLNMKLRNIQLLQQNLTESDHHVLLEEISELEEKLNQERENIAQCATRKSALKKHIEELQNQINNAEANREKNRTDADEGLKMAKRLFDASTKKLQKEEQNFEVLSREIKHNEETLATVQEQLTKVQDDITALNEEMNRLGNQIAEEQLVIDQAEGLFNDCKRRLSDKSKEIKQRQKRLDLLQKSMEDNETAVKTLKHKIDNVKTSIKDAASNLRNYEHKYHFIAEEKESFNNPESEYQVLHSNSFKAEEFAAELSQLKKDRDSMLKTVNMKATIMQGEKQRECEELQRKKEIIISDRDKLRKYIDKVEKEKDNALRNAYEKINENFGQIFNTFLPYANCKLSTVSTNNIKDGLEIKVCFGSVWKESLSELSGGQRSLVALSLVLALLRYNPAPLYILDEVDAALDQSHTQNIGLMIKRYFKNSQFIIVSLKDDMFNNANVLFQTKFVDGFSTVSRRALQV